MVKHLPIVPGELIYDVMNTTDGLGIPLDILTKYGCCNIFLITCESYDLRGVRYYLENQPKKYPIELMLLVTLIRRYNTYHDVVHAKGMSELLAMLDAKPNLDIDICSAYNCVKAKIRKGNS